MSSLYSIYEVEAMTGISAYTIRYYDKCGFLPDLLRDKAKVRCFRKSDIEQLKLIEALRNSGLSIKELETFVAIQKDPDKQNEMIERLQAQLDHIIVEHAILDKSEEIIRDSIRANTNMET